MTLLPAFSIHVKRSVRTVCCLRSWGSELKLLAHYLTKERNSLVMILSDSLKYCAAASALLARLAITPECLITPQVDKRHLIDVFGHAVVGWSAHSTRHIESFFPGTFAL